MFPIIKILSKALNHRYLYMIWGVTCLGMIFLNIGQIKQSFLVNHTSVLLTNRLLSGNMAVIPSETLAALTQQADERSLRLVVISQILMNNYVAVEEGIQEYISVASSQQIEQMQYWISNWSLRLASCGERAQAEQAMRLLFTFGDDATAYSGLSRLYQDLGQVEDAIQFLDKSLAIRPNADAFVQLGSLYADQGIPLYKTDYQEAMRLLTLSSNAFESAMDLDPTVSVYANYRLGIIYLKLNRPQEAVQAYLHAAENGGSGQYAFLSWYYLGQIYSSWWTEGLDYNLARKYFEHALSVAPSGRDRAMCLTGIGITYVEQSRNQDAIVAFQRALQSDPTYEPARDAITALEEGK